METARGIGTPPPRGPCFPNRPRRAVFSALFFMPERRAHGKDGKNSRAYASVKKVCPEVDDKELCCFEFPMTRDEKILEERRDRIFERVKEFDGQGKNVAMLVIGDPNIYATYSYIELRLKRAGIACESISGINSFTASAAALSIPLVMDDEELHVIPGSADLREALELKGTKVFMKLGKAKQSKLFELLKPTGLTINATGGEAV